MKTAVPVTRAELREVFGVTDRTMSTYKGAGLLVNASHDRYDLARSTQAVIAFLRNHKGADPVQVDLKDRLTEAQAIRVELENAQTKKSLLRTGDVLSVMRIVVHTTAQWLDQLGDHMQRRGAVSNVGVFTEALDSQREQLLLNLGKDIEDFIEASDSE